MLCLKPIFGSELEPRAEPELYLYRPRPTMTAFAIRHPGLGIDYDTFHPWTGNFASP